ncbi:ATP-binding cassette domain-containing protein [Treponema ruminis]|uniref:Peptide/nickel transport system permease protein n=1 Tax=Treponema ruminis TaxID=744515 RepID=A0A7W8G9H5_9SPIR|nr:dipeptide/oligopeptide/nickel ABC transporter permease/ATP-binding protein [Treponema ruminis]MBB5226272.1 peptide/nickel transport system permease protein [Treponema ruminis]QSI02821.1 ATP-binding cassette domain-containing protein [Treponema ruminis]
MNRLFQYLKTRPLAIISVAVLVLLYLFMIFAPFISPYTPTRTFEEDTFHPSNIEITRQGIVAREYRVLNPITWRYAKVKGKEFHHKISFFVKGEPYKLFGLIPSERHLFGTKPDPRTGELYPVFLFGADNLGRDLFSRMVYGSRISLTIGFVASAISLVLAILLGGLAGYYGGKTDWAVMRFSEFFMLIPGLYLILFLRSLLNSKMDSGTSYMIITVILSLVGWPGTARTLRGMVHAIKREEFVLDAGLEGIPSTVIIFAHIIPQITSLLIVSTTLAIPLFIMSETTLSYLGLGIADPAVSWGSLINRDISTLSNLKNFPWLLTPVYLLLAVTLAFNFLGDALRDYFDPYHVVFKTWKKKGALPAFSRSGLSHFRSRSIPAQQAAPERTSCGATAPSASKHKSMRCSTVSAGTPFLSVENLRVSFTVLRGASQTVIKSVRGVSFSMNRGEILGIVGESGSGKSVTTTAIPALHPSNATVEGKIFFDGVELTSLSQKEMRTYRGKKIGLIFQEPGRSFDPLQNIGSVFLETFRNSDPKITKEEAYKKAIELLDEVGLPDPASRLKNFPHQFSGGQLQRIGIALSLAQGCELLIADEPTTALDVTIQAQIVGLLANLRKTRNLSIIFISHNIDLVASLCDKIIVMYGGLIMESGTSEQIMNHARHPYTQALLASSPKFGTHYTSQKLLSIPGRVTDPAHPEPGCPFEPRCSFAKEECRNAGSECHKMRKG